jgi:hypothetical protein
MKKNNSMKIKILIGMLVTAAAKLTLLAQSSAFTYQGRLFDGNQAAVGTYDLQFRLADAPTNSNYVGVTLVRAPVSVTNGVFTVTLDFGPGVFDGSARFLEAGVRTNGSSSDYVILQPLQAITTAPYAMLANTAAAAGVASNLVAGAVLTNLVIAGSTIQPGTITAAQIDPATDAAYRALDTNAVKALIAQVVASTPSPGVSSRWVDAKINFGAKGDGTTDDTAALQAGLNYLASASASNATLYLPPGTYRLSSILTLPSSVFPQDPVLGLNTGWRISGAGLSQTRLFWPSLGNGIGLALTNGSGYEAVTLEDFSLIGPLMTAWDPANTSIGLALGTYSAVQGWSGQNNVIRNCGIIGWGYGVASTNQWGLVVDNCVIASNNWEGLRFVGTHLVSVQNCRIRGGWSTACGIGIGFHPPLNWGYGDNAQILNTLIGYCTNGIFNQELNLVSVNTHLEACGSYYTLISPTVLGTAAPATTIIGGYTLDYGLAWTNGFAGQMLMDARAAQSTFIQNSWFTGGPRPAFNVTNLDSTFALPTYSGGYYFAGLWNTTSNVVLFASTQSGGTSLVRASGQISPISGPWAGAPASSQARLQARQAPNSQ